MSREGRQDLMEDKRIPMSSWRSPPRRVRVGDQWLPKPPSPRRPLRPWVKAKAQPRAVERHLSAKAMAKEKELATDSKRRKRVKASTHKHLTGNQNPEQAPSGQRVPKWRCMPCSDLLQKKVVNFGFRSSCPFCHRPAPPDILEAQKAQRAAGQAEKRKIIDQNRQEFILKRDARRLQASAAASSSISLVTAAAVNNRWTSFLARQQKAKRLKSQMFSEQELHIINGRALFITCLNTLILNAKLADEARLLRVECKAMELEDRAVVLKEEFLKEEARQQYLETLSMSLEDSIVVVTIQEDRLQLMETQWMVCEDRSVPVRSSP